VAVTRYRQGLLESEASFRMLADVTPILAWMSDAHKNFTYFNARWLQFTGRTLKKESGSGWTKGGSPLHEPPLTLPSPLPLRVGGEEVTP